MATKVVTFVELASIFNRRYATEISEAKRLHEDKKLWNKITEDLFKNHSKEMNIEDISDFRSKLGVARHKIKELKSTEKKKVLVQQLALDLKPWYHQRNA